MSTATPSAATLEAIYALPDEVRCLYSSKNCPHHRAVKDNGDLHKLCDLHRTKANINQQRMQERRKIMRQKMIDAKQQYLASVTSCSSTSSVPKIKIEGLLEPCPHPCGSKFSAEDLRLLELILFDRDELSMSNDIAFLQSLDVTL